MRDKTGRADRRKLSGESIEARKPVRAYRFLLQNDPKRERIFPGERVLM